MAPCTYRWDGGVPADIWGWIDTAESGEGAPRTRAQCASLALFLISLTFSPLSCVQPPQAFAPQPTYSVERSKLCISMATPLGTRNEWLHPYGPAETDKDPQGHTFNKTVRWEGEKLVSTFECEEIADVVTTRWLEHHEDLTYLLQETRYEDASFLRRFVRIDDDAEEGAPNSSELL